ncbi:MAG TPA: ThuA domain-containing protein [Candidatus Hydrogenedentes bacterium]|nr:ThuA domain-containing protein [Candidatus Hydrogenedentota bacterium]HRK35561.1 ThuA domain-containing protein [Candidatus Hydrogenedentota bacterium]
MKARALLFTGALLFVFALSVAAEEAKAPLKCLMLGTGPHKDVTMTEVIDDINANHKSIALTVTENLEDLRYENLKNYDVLLWIQLKVEGGNPPDFVKESIVQFLKDGKGLVATHFSVANTQEWRDSIDILGAMWVSGKSTHGPYREFRVDVKQEHHPILEGVKPFITNDELYFNLLMRPDMNVLLTGNEERFGHTVAEPLLCTHYVHNARCVYFALGHDVKSVAVPEYRKILVQSIEWAGCRR